MHAELWEEGFDVRRHRVARLMRDNFLEVLQNRRYKKTTDSHHGGPVAANLFEQDFDPKGSIRSGRRHQLCLDGRGLALSGDRARSLLQAHCRRGMSDRLKKDLALNALLRAIALRNPLPDLVQHTERGNQYCLHDYQWLL